MLKPDDFRARFAFVDYDGKKAYANYKKILRKQRMMK